MAGRHTDEADPVEIANAYEEDPQAAQAEYGATFRDDLIGFISMETLEAITQRGRVGLPRVSGVQYFGFVDPSGGVNDSMTMAVGHRDGNTAVLDQVLESDAHDDLANSVAGVLANLDLDRRPALVKQGRLVQAGGGGYPMPDTRANPVIVTVCVNKHGQVGAVYSLLAGNKLLFLDNDVGFFTTEFLNSVAARAIELQASIQMSVAAATYRLAMFGNTPEAPLLFIVAMGAAASVTSFAGVAAHSLDIVPEDLVMFIPAYTQQDRVRYSTIVVEKSRSLSLGGALDIRPGVILEEDVLRAAAITSVVVTLPDEDRVKTKSGQSSSWAALG